MLCRGRAQSNSPNGLRRCPFEFVGAITLICHWRCARAARSAARRCPRKARQRASAATNAPFAKPAAPPWKDAVPIAAANSSRVHDASNAHETRMNYRHAYHAGNFADVHKHVALVAVLLHLRKKETPFAVIDTHAGRGLYDLAADESVRT